MWETTQPELLYLGVKAVMVRVNGQGEKEILLLKAVSQSVEGGWRWDLPGGRLNQGEETIEQVLQREVNEELGLSEEEIGSLLAGRKAKCLGVQIVPRPTLKAGLVLCFYEFFLNKNLAEKTDWQLSDEHIAWQWQSIHRLVDLTNSDGRPTDWAVFLASKLN